MADYTQYPSMQPCCGGRAKVRDPGLPAPFGIPVATFLLSGGSGTSVPACLDLDQAEVSHTMTLENADQWAIESQRGYAASLVSHATNDRYATIADHAGFRPTNGIFTVAMLFKIGASYADGDGFFEKNDGADGNGYGVYWDGGDLSGWVNDPLGTAVRITPSVGGWVAGQWALLIFQSTGSALNMRLTTSAGTQTATAAVVATSLATATESLFVGASRLGGTTAINGSLALFSFWAGAALHTSSMLALEADPFCGVTFPTGQVLNLIAPQTIQVVAGCAAIGVSRFSMYLSPDYVPGSDPTVFDIPGTPSSELTQQQWLDSTLGATSIGTSSAILQVNTDGGPNWPDALAARGLRAAVIVPSSFFNGNTGPPLFLGNASEVNGSVLRRRVDAIWAYLTGIEHVPVDLTDPDHNYITGWSAGAAWAMPAALARPDRWRHCVTMHSVVFGGEANINQYLEALPARRRDHVVPPAGTWGNALSTFTLDPDAANTSGTEANGFTNDWQTNADAKLVRVLWVTGTSPADGPISQIPTDIALFQAQGYNLIRQKHYTSGRNAGHVKGRDVIALFMATRGFSAFAGGTAAGVRGELGIQ